MSEARDHGPDIRRHPIRTRDGHLLRAADVTLEEGPDPDQPNRTTRRARRTDPLAVLRSRGSISARGVLAAEKLRGQIETAHAPAPSAGQAEVHVPAHQRLAISIEQIAAATGMRLALAAVAMPNRAVLLWTTCGGTLGGYVQHARIRPATATERLAAGLEQLAEHYGT